MIISFYSGPEITKTFLADVAQPGGKFSILPTLRPLTSMKSLLFFYRARPPPPGVLEFENGPFSVREFVKTISFGVREKTKYHERFRVKSKHLEGMNFKIFFNRGEEIMYLIESI